MVWRVCANLDLLNVCGTRKLLPNFAIIADVSNASGIRVLCKGLSRKLSGVPLIAMLVV